jgi:hypothetical protein
MEMYRECTGYVPFMYGKCTIDVRTKYYQGTTEVLNASTFLVLLARRNYGVTGYFGEGERGVICDSFCLSFLSDRTTSPSLWPDRPSPFVRQKDQNLLPIPR